MEGSNDVNKFCNVFFFQLSVNVLEMCVVFRE